MNEEDLKNIEPPNKKEITSKQQRRNTLIFTIISSVLNLVYTIAIVFGLILLFGYLSVLINSSAIIANTETWAKIIMWVSVIVGIVLGFIIQKLLAKLVINGFHLQDKLEKDFVERYCGKKTK